MTEHPTRNASARIRLEPVTLDNWEELAMLRVAPDQEQFIRPNWYSIAESQFYEQAKLWAILNDTDDYVGLTFYWFDPNDRQCWLLRIMIAESYQGRGYGAAAIQYVIEDAKTSFAADALNLSVVPGNVQAMAIYEHMGFEFTGKFKPASWTPPQLIYRLNLS